MSYGDCDDLTASRERPMIWFCEHNSEFLGSVKACHFLTNRANYQMLDNILIPAFLWGQMNKTAKTLGRRLGFELGNTSRIKSNTLQLCQPTHSVNSTRKLY
jgi:hypothetical protein